VGCSNYYEDLINRYVEGLVTVEEKDILESHIKVCPECSQEVKELKEIIRTLGSTEPVELPQDFTPILMEKIKGISDRQNFREKTPPRLSGILKNLLALLSDYYNHNKRAFVVVMSILIIGIFVLTIYNQENFNVNYATKSVKEEAAYESAPSDQSTMMMDSSGAFGQTEAESKSISQDTLSNKADIGLQTFSSEERTQKIIKSADITIYVEKFDEKVAEIIKMVDELGGYIESSQIQGEKSADSSQRAHLALRIPEAKLNDALERIKTLGRVTNQQIKGEDITDNYYDTDARIRNLVQQEQRLLEILKMAENVDEILRIENELNRVRTEIDMLQGQIKMWDKMVEMSLVSVNLIEQEPSKERVTVITLDELLQKVKQGFISAVNISMNILAFLAEFMGAIIPVVLVIAALYLIIRRFSKKSGS